MLSLARGLSMTAARWLGPFPTRDPGQVTLLPVSIPDWESEDDKNGPPNRAGDTRRTVWAAGTLAFPHACSRPRPVSTVSNPKR